MKATGVTDKARKYLRDFDLQEIINNLPSRVEPSEEVNSMDEALVWVENLNENVHPDYLIIEP